MPRSFSSWPGLRRSPNSGWEPKRFNVPSSFQEGWIGESDLNHLHADLQTGTSVGDSSACGLSLGHFSAGALALSAANTQSAIEATTVPCEVEQWLLRGLSAPARLAVGSPVQLLSPQVIPPDQTIACSRTCPPGAPLRKTGTEVETDQEESESESDHEEEKEEAPIALVEFLRAFLRASIANQATTVDPSWLLARLDEVFSAQEYTADKVWP